MRLLAFLLVLVGGVQASRASQPVEAVHRHGQTFITWQDAAAGEAGAKFRYSVYRAQQPITVKSLAAAEKCNQGVPCSLRTEPLHCRCPRHALR